LKLDDKALLNHRKGFDDLETVLVSSWLKLDNSLELSGIIERTRYVINFAKLTVVRNKDGEDIGVMEAIGAHSWQVREKLSFLQGATEMDFSHLKSVLPSLVGITVRAREQLLDSLPIDRESLDREICNRKLVLVMGGGGGAGYGYGGVLTLLDRYMLNPSLICGTSIGALIGLYRARRLRHDPAAMHAASNKISWSNVFERGKEPSRYGLPATLRLHLRRSVGEFFTDESGNTLTMEQLPVPMHIVATGLSVGALKHELEYYEHLLDDVVKPGSKFRVKSLFKLRNLATVAKEFASEPEALKEVVFGRDPLTMEADCVDAAGFSAGIPGLIHYDIHRDDQRMHRLMGQLYSEYGITRLVEGGIVNNVPVKVGFQSAMEGRLDGHRNVFILGVDCFAPRLGSVMFYPVQQLVRGNVLKNKPYANTWVSFSKTLNALNLVPKADQIYEAGQWAMEDLMPSIPVIEAIFKPIPTLESEA
jgi:predicted acylesterase/phospholipase RssA